MNFDNNLPIYLQVIEDLKLKVVNGTFSPGQKLPSTRDLALDYQINPNTANRIYNELEAEGFCYTKRGLGTFLTDDPSIIHTYQVQLGEQLLSNFLNGMTRLGYTKPEILDLIQKNL